MKNNNLSRPIARHYIEITIAIEVGIDRRLGILGMAEFSSDLPGGRSGCILKQGDAIDRFTAGHHHIEVSIPIEIAKIDLVRVCDHARFPIRRHVELAGLIQVKRAMALVRGGQIHPIIVIEVEHVDVVTICRFA